MQTIVVILRRRSLPTKNLSLRHVANFRWYSLISLEREKDCHNQREIQWRTQREILRYAT